MSMFRLLWAQMLLVWLAIRVMVATVGGLNAVWILVAAPVTVLRNPAVLAEIDPNYGAVFMLALWLVALAIAAACWRVLRNVQRDWSRESDRLFAAFTAVT